MKARVWKDRRLNRWCYDVTGHGLRSTGDRATWRDALDEALDDMRWIDRHRHAWPDSLLSLRWRNCRR